MREDINQTCNSTVEHRPRLESGMNMWYQNTDLRRL
jgi:hypothetical protein